MKIYLKLNKKPKTIQELLLELFAYGNNDKRTNVNTYNNKDCTSLQCNENKFRSFDEVYDIICTYFPRTTLKEAIHELISLDFGLENPLYIKMINCSTINRIVLYYTTESFNSNIFGIAKYNSIYSWDDLLLYLNIKSKEELKSYVKKYIKVKETISDKINSIEKLKECIKDFKTPYNLDTVDKRQRAHNALYILLNVADIYNEGKTIEWGTKYGYLPYKYFPRGGGFSGVATSFSWRSVFTPACLYYVNPKLSEASYENFKSYWEDFWTI